MSYYKCERVVSDKGKSKYCNNMAKFISPPGIYTERVIKVCAQCKKGIINYYHTLDKTAKFTKIEYAPEPEIKEKKKAPLPEYYGSP